MKNVNLGDNVLKDDSIVTISTCLHNIEELSVPHCQLTTGGIQILCNALKLLDVPVREI